MRPFQVAAATLLLSVGAHAQTWVGHQLAVSEAAESPRISDAGTGAAQGVSMRFVADRSRSVAALWVAVAEISGSGADSIYRVGIASDAVGGLPGAFLASATVELSTLGWMRVVLAAPASLQAGATYHLVVQPENVKSKVVRLRELQGRIERSPPLSASSDRAVLHLRNSAWTVTDRTPVFLLEGDGQDPWTLPTCIAGSRFDVEGNPYVGVDESLAVFGSRTPEQRFFVAGETWITRVEVLLSTRLLSALVPIHFELRAADSNQRTIASGELTAGADEAGGTWYGANLTAPLKLDDGTPPLTTQYLLHLKAPLGVNLVSEYRWLATTSEGAGAATDDCSPHVRAGFGGAHARAIEISGGTATEKRGLDAIFRLATCAPVTWYEDGDGDGFGRNDRTVLACAKPAGHVAVGGDCDDGDPTRHPDAVDICNGKDDDCDGAMDEADPGVGARCSTGLPGLCGSGEERCVAGSLTCVQTVNASPEICDGADNDCDGLIDEDDPGGGDACETSELGPCKVGVTSCRSGAIACVSTFVKTAELCDGVDNDCNGVVDDPAPTSIHCDDGNPCTADLCVEATCTHPFGNDGAVCDDGDTCTSGDVCRAGLCAGTLTPGVGCGFDAGSPFSAAPTEVVADGSAASVLSARAQRSTGAVLDGQVSFTCTFGTLDVPEQQSDGSWRARLRSNEPGRSTCTAWAPGGQPFATKVEVVFVPAELATLALTASATDAVAGEPVTITASLPKGAPLPSLLRIELPSALELVPDSGRSGSQPWSVEARSGGAIGELPEAASGALTLTFDVRALPEAVPGPVTIKARTIRSGTPTSNEAEVEVRIVEFYDIGGCGCASAGSGAGAFGLLALAALWRRVRRPH